MLTGSKVDIGNVGQEMESKGQGLAAVMFKYMEELCLQKGVFSIKADTHNDNLAMQKVLKKTGFNIVG